MNEARNVTPEHERDRLGQTGSDRRSDQGEWTGWTWEGRGRSFPWLGVLLVLIGVALLIQYAVPAVGVGTLVLLAIGLAFLVGWIVGGSRFSIVPGILFLALGIAELIEDLAFLGPPGEDVPGLASSALALGFLLIWLVGYATNRRSSWPLWGAAIFGLIGVAQLSGRLVNIPALGALWPVLIIVAGIVLLLAARNRS